MASIALQPRPLTEKRPQPPRVAIVASLYNDLLVNGLLNACQSELLAIDPDIQLQVVRVPGAFEIPVAIAHLAKQDRVDVIIALGVIIRGATAHADLVGTSVTNALQSIAIDSGIPVIHEVLLLSLAEAEERCLGAEINRGTEAARTAISMADVVAQIGTSAPCLP
jgi:6,7-dimethyl-8-ribityllumazine synthase